MKGADKWGTGMTGFEYKVVPAPMRGLKAKGVKGTPARFANALETLMNELGAEGWEYQRTDTLPVEERQGLTGKTTNFQNMLVFRRALVEAEVETPEVTALIEDQTPVAEPAPEAETVEPEVAEETSPEEVHSADEAEPAEQPEVAADPLRLAADKRVNETITAPFVFPWAKRGSRKSAAPDDEAGNSNVPAE